MEKQKNGSTEQSLSIPKLRFPGFEDSWTNEKMGKLFSFKVTNSFSRENLNYEVGSVKNIHYGDIHKNFHSLFDITKESVPFINPEIAIERISYDNYCQEGDLILADASEDLADVGKSIELVNINNETLLSGLHTILARPVNEKFCIGFIGYLFKSNWVRTQIQKESQGSKVLSISSTRLSNISLLFPSKEEQSRIASFLSAIDEKIKLETQRIAALKQYKKGVMQKLFSQELRFKDENGKEFPDWEVKKLGEILIEENKKTNKSNQYRILSSTVKGIFNQDDYFKRDIASKDNSGYKILKKGQLVFSPQNLWLGNINVNMIFEIGIVSPSYKIFSFDLNSLSTD